MSTAPSTAAPSVRRPSRAARLRRALPPWLLLAPALITLGVLLLWPMIRVADLSLQKFRLRHLLRGEREYIVLENYQKILTDDHLWLTVLPNTIGFAAVCVAATMLVGTVVALFLNTLSTPWRIICTTAIMVAWAVPALTGTYIFVWLFDPHSGFVAGVLEWLGLLEADTVNWWNNRWAFYGIAALNVVYHGFPFIAVTILAGLMTVPKELYEAARVDGAGAWRRFASVTVPTMRPIFAVCLILSTIWDFKVFTQIYLMPGGDGSNRSVMNLGVWSYTEAAGQGHYGMGAAIAVLLTALLLVISVVYLRTLLKEDDL
ncbi:carbohydrate ABC transporter permease [Helcobacillus massiliensis]|uniref:N,N'-diacetylchitobiose transport system permease protein n=1 Tax=Helcobacillus massiliensis TaxID=521392 RepID=A0A839QQT6_9MICO|nr:sugar ABC transporter permease [Helcobacillus massiliensis]MBB3022372.1 N,N'-diacetylchitobiose transport system permease protein [Helcobacillus massiliensis]